MKRQFFSESGIAGDSRRTRSLRSGLLMLFVMGALVLAACSSDSGSSEVRPFEEVQASEMTFENDPTFVGRGIFHVTTTEPLICAIVWGETEALGNFNNSLAMNGTGIVEHDVLLPFAEAGKTYFYRVQGSTADGTLYQSELMTFTLPMEEAAPPDEVEQDLGENVAEGATVTEVSSVFSSSWLGSNAFDGDLNTEWATKGDGDGGFVEVDLGSPQNIIALELLTRSMTDGSATALTYMVIVDGTDTYGPFEPGNGATRAVHDAIFTGQILRFEFDTTTGGNTGAIEIRAFVAP
jgi:hypothetical protein